MRRHTWARRPLAARALRPALFPLVNPQYRREPPGRFVLTLGLFLPGCCIALTIVIRVGS